MLLITQAPELRLSRAAYDAEKDTEGQKYQAIALDNLARCQPILAGNDDLERCKESIESVMGLLLIKYLRGRLGM